MKKPLHNIIFGSEKRKNVLLLLQEDAQKIENLLNSLETTRTGLLPQIRILEDYHLVEHRKDIYGLTTLGRMVVNKMNPLLCTSGTLGNDIDYWGTHDLGFIPSHVLRQINKLINCQVETHEMSDMYSAHPTYLESCKKSKFAYGYTKSFYPNTAEFFSELISRKVSVNIIIPEELLDKIRTYQYDSYSELVESNYLNLYLYPEDIDLLSIAFNDYYLVMRLLRNEGGYDNQYIFCSCPEALSWGKDLFDYYLKDSIPITEL